MKPRAALLLVDMQHDFLDRPGLEPDAGTLVSQAARLLGWFRAKRWPVVHVNTRADADGSNWMPHWRRAGHAPCLEGSAGAKAPDDVAPADGEAIVEKVYYDGFENPDLLASLRREQVDTVVVAGVHTHACVRSTACSAYARGFEVLIPSDAVGSYDPGHAALTLEWLEGRVGRCLPVSSIEKLFETGTRDAWAGRESWQHRDPTGRSDILFEIPVDRPDEIGARAGKLDRRAGELAAMPMGRRADMLRRWYDGLDGMRGEWVDALVRDVAKPRADAEGEVTYGLALLNQFCRTLADEEEGLGCRIRYHPLGTVGIITPWNNPFAMPVSKIGPALGFGNAVLWKPALPGAAIALRLKESLEQVGLADWVELALGGAAAGQAVVAAPQLAALSFTGSVEVGQRIARRCGQLLRPAQAELGGNNAAIVLADADIAAAAKDLAGAMFSFSGQRCTAIRRVIVERPVLDDFADAFRRKVESLVVGMPDDSDTDVGPVIAKETQRELLAAIDEAVAAGARMVAGGTMPTDLPEGGCWVAPSVLADLPPGSPLIEEEQFGPVAALIPADDLDEAIGQHNRVRQGLLGAIYTANPQAQARFLAEAQAGALVINQARPAFSPAGPFAGWKDSGYGMAEHGRWNRDFYTRVQAVY